MIKNETVYRDKKIGGIDGLILKLIKQGEKYDAPVEKVGNIRRIFAYLIDFYTASVCSCIPLVYIISIVKNETDFTSDLSTLPVQYAYLAGGLAIAMYLIYYVLVPLKTKGQTLGKRLMGFRIVQMNDENVTFWNLIRREVLGVMLVEGYIAASSTYLQQLLQISFHISLGNIYFYVFGTITVLSILSSFMTPQRRMLHDFISGCKVVPIHNESEERTAF